MRVSSSRGSFPAFGERQEGGARLGSQSSDVAGESGGAHRLRDAGLGRGTGVSTAGAHSQPAAPPPHSPPPARSQSHRRAPAHPAAAPRDPAEARADAGGARPDPGRPRPGPPSPRALTSARGAGSGRTSGDGRLRASGGRRAAGGGSGAGPELRRRLRLAARAAPPLPRPPLRSCEAAFRGSCAVSVLTQQPFVEFLVGVKPCEGYEDNSLVHPRLLCPVPHPKQKLQLFPVLNPVSVLVTILTSLDLPGAFDLPRLFPVLLFQLSPNLRFLPLLPFQCWSSMRRQPLLPPSFLVCLSPSDSLPFKPTLLQHRRRPCLLPPLVLLFLTLQQSPSPVILSHLRSPFSLHSLPLLRLISTSLLTQITAPALSPVSEFPVLHFQAILHWATTVIL